MNKLFQAVILVCTSVCAVACGVGTWVFAHRIGDPTADYLLLQLAVSTVVHAHLAVRSARRLIRLGG